MKVCSLSLCFLAAAFISSWRVGAGHRRLHLGLCEVSVNVNEIRNSFSEIRKVIQSQDDNSGVRIVEKSSLQDAMPEERCCLLRHLLRFYMHQVFKRWDTTDQHLRRKISIIANNFLSIKKDLSHCHTHMTCNCGDSSMLNYKVIQKKFEKMNPSISAIKALGELDIVLDWMDRLQ